MERRSIEAVNRYGTAGIAARIAIMESGNEKDVADSLTVIILERGERIRLIHLANPRESFIREFNEQGREFGLEARPFTPSLSPHA